MDLALVAVAAAGFILLARPRLLSAQLWRATATPLASIIGSGFLVLGPILAASYGRWAPLAMGGLCLAAWWFGGTIRYAIAARAEAPAHPDWLDAVAGWALAGAYFISVAYYLNLFGAFALSLTPWSDPTSARVAASSAIILLLGLGWRRGFGAVERLEMLTVAVKLAVIAALLAGLAVWFLGRWGEGALIAPPPRLDLVSALTLGFGLVVTVQGFETSRYLKAYPPALRIRSMRLAQVVASAIYLAYVALLTYALPVPADAALTETSIIAMTGAVAPILPILIVAAALSAQISAAAADANGAGGLLEEATAGRLAAGRGYLAIGALALALTWGADVFAIISYASRAFALYYALEALVAMRLARARGEEGRAVAYAALAALGFAILLFGRAPEAI